MSSPLNISCPTCHGSGLGPITQSGSGEMAVISAPGCFHCSGIGRVPQKENEWGCEARRKLGLARGALLEARIVLEDTHTMVTEALEQTGQPEPCPDIEAKVSNKDDLDFPVYSQPDEEELKYLREFSKKCRAIVESCTEGSTVQIASSHLWDYLSTETGKHRPWSKTLPWEKE